MEISLPPSSGFTNYWDNVGEILNKGVEFSIKTHNIDRAFKGQQILMWLIIIMKLPVLVLILKML